MASQHQLHCKVLRDAGQAQSDKLELIYPVSKLIEFFQFTQNSITASSVAYKARRPVGIAVVLRIPVIAVKPRVCTG